MKSPVPCISHGTFTHSSSFSYHETLTFFFSHGTIKSRVQFRTMNFLSCPLLMVFSQLHATARHESSHSTNPKKIHGTTLLACRLCFAPAPLRGIAAQPWVRSHFHRRLQTSLHLQFNTHFAFTQKRAPTFVNALLSIYFTYTSAPNGARESDASLKHCFPNGIPIMVI